jgi:hypothetical protein
VDKPELLKLKQIVYGDFLDPANRIEIPSQSSAMTEALNDRFSIAISHKSPAQPATKTGELAKVKYEILPNAFGTVKIAPTQVVFTDRDGNRLKSATSDLLVNIEHAIFENRGQTITGSVILPKGSTGGSATITLVLLDNGYVYTAILNPDGSFYIKDLKEGTYKIWIDNAPYFSQCVTVEVVKGEPIVIQPIALLNGDVNGDGMIDIGDVTLVAFYFGQYVPPADKRTDLNNDGLVNVQDLAIVGAHFGVQRCQ